MKNNRKKVKEYLFVDGYNIINSWESLKEKQKISLEDARDSLLEILADYHHYSGIEIIVVFDAHLVKGNSGKEFTYKGIDVVFTKELETADHYIERTLDSLGRIKRIRVATSDWLEQQMVLSRGGTRISARELEVEIYNARRMIKRRKKINNTKNNVYLGKLDDSIIDKLDKWNKT
ncbi:MAG TPA: NYN domain-containing protein [Tissierellaceae bacterium]|nr:NYN domain-containing protein [Tissierellaceae bacterium]